MRYWFPYPLLSLALLMLWLLINQSLSPGQVVLGSVLGVVLAWIMVNLQPDKTRLKNYGVIAVLAGHVAADIVRSNIAVMSAILRAGKRPINSGFVTIDISLRDENALAVLACILTATPGTAWLEFDRQTGVLMIHVLDLENGAAWSELVRNRYEAPLKEIFE
ncbi:Na+/H+ antiporter subunit E [Rhizobium sp. LjRoot98]|uniref:Na+/H+ antiporter subunit E n=1 Tax=unclassified Rhizobium TaxID=2613769 RepID=UPI0007150E89|nr:MULTISPECIES: Na+/H+ antiporter subunit E [unclassified Rhizobium]KQV38993.1 cation:proton antiporter [Rhizobium sp. Root1204]KQY16023.1 cation:proton antiporter [Rhizobium sp. Root1334]KRC10198.1 cation:proton antiporter [Rhizobium sp. Root73]